MIEGILIGLTTALTPTNMLMVMLGSGDVHYIGVALTLLALAPYVFVGLVIVHALARGWGPYAKK